MVIHAATAEAGRCRRTPIFTKTSGQSGTQRVMENALPDCAVLQGLAIQENTAQENEARTRGLLTDWLAGLRLLK